ncbi:protein translocase subunit SecD [Thermus thermamylovorans]|uniref:Multifunctional fusion protein n=1 Tax=Thermus thermamylovorans TaxID=2509362 RepID=A0A4Q9B6Z9_9DEIN|nr:protein translocase subunit SecD [Thermus thermamylovorans]TBH21536.1 protein translocase subunit SecD [Thermus thermamylovorans]
MNRRLVTGLLLLAAFIGAVLVVWKPWAPEEPKVRLGLDLQGGLRVVLEADVPEPTLDDLEKARIVLLNRIDALGVAEPLVQLEGQKRIVVELPGLSQADQERALNLIGQRAVLEFRILREGATGVTVAQINQALRENPRLRREDLERDLIRPEDLGPPLLTGADLADARAVFDPFGRPQVSLTFTPEGARRFEEVTRANIGRQLAVVLDGKVYTAPVIRQAITGGQAVIEGLASLEEASEIALVLRSGALPVPLQVAEIRAIGPTLGQDAIEAGLRAALIGTLAIFLLIFAYYGLSLGMVVALGLLYTGVLILGLLSGLGATLTLPGIAGLILTLGAAVDGNVLIQERIKEELRAGKRFRQAVAEGFRHSTVTILDVNITHLLAAAALYQYATGPVRGFAVILAIGVLASMFSNLVFSRFLLERMAERGTPRFPTWFQRPNLNFMRPAPLITTLSLLLALLAGGVIGLKGFNYSIDFTGGTAYLIRTGPEVEVEGIRRFLEAEGAPAREAVISRVEAPLADYREFMVKLPLQEDAARTALEAAFAERMGALVLQSETVGPAVGAELRRNALMAVLVGLGLIFIYMAFRFDLAFGTAALIAIAHDVAIVAGMYSLFGLEFSIPTIAALLTVVGYSINDSIVVSDRIRENLRLMRGVPFVEVVNRSVNQTLSRTVMTSLTTLLPVLALLFLGGSVLRDFALAIFVGILVGTYSSIYVVGALVVFWRAYRGRREKVPSR